MLKLERKKRSEGVCVILQTRSVFFNRTFLAALAIALFMHLGALFLFTIDTFGFRQSDVIHPPVLLEADLNQDLHSLQEAVANLDKELLAKSFLEPDLTQIHYPPIQPPNFAIIPESQQLSLLPLPLMSLDRERELFNAERTLPSIFFSIETYGPLAEFTKLEINPELLSFYEALTRLAPPAQLHQFRYGVRVMKEGNQGQIIWFQKNSASSDSAIESWLNSLLPLLSFQMKKNQIFVNGEIEFTLKLERSP